VVFAPTGMVKWTGLAIKGTVDAAGWEIPARCYVGLVWPLSSPMILQFRPPSNRSATGTAYPVIVRAVFPKECIR
jgi:hypothetical protein